MDQHVNRLTHSVSEASLTETTPLTIPAHTHSVFGPNPQVKALVEVAGALKNLLVKIPRGDLPDTCMLVNALPNGITIKPLRDCDIYTRESGQDFARILGNESSTFPAPQTVNGNLEIAVLPKGKEPENGVRIIRWRLNQDRNSVFDAYQLTSQ